MRTTRKVLLALVLTLCVAAVLSVCAFAFDIYTDLPTGVTKDQEGWEGSGYNDVDTEEGWYMIGTNDKNSKVANGQFPKLTFLENARFYWNKTTGEAVWLILTTMSGNSGMTTVIDPRQMGEHSAGRQSLYKYACIFVDIAERAGAATEDPNGYAKNMQAKYPVWYRYTITKDPVANKELASTGQWGKVTVTATQYEQYTAKRAELVASGYADEDLQDALVEYVNVTFTGLSVAQNCLFDGAFYSTAWVFNQMSNNGYAFNVVEFRREKSATVATFGTAGLVTQLFEAKTVLMDSRITGLNLTNTSRALLMNNAALTTFDHVEYADYTGYYDEGTVVSGVVDLSGFKVFTPHTNDSKNAEYAFSHILAGCTGMTKVVWFDSIISNGDISSKYAGAVIKVGDDEAGRIDSYNLDGCTSLKEVTLTAPLTAIKANAFKNCTALTTINLNGGVAEGVEIAATAFTNVKQEITVYVKTAIDEVKAKVAFAEFDNIKVINKSPLKNPIIAEGFQFRIHNYSGLRSIFTLDASVVLENGGAEKLKDYGVITFTEKVLSNVYGGDLRAVLFAALSGNLTEDEAKRIRKVSVMEANRFVEVFEEGKTADDYMYADAVGDKTFCITLTNIPDQNVTDAVYSVAYSIWNTDNGGTDYSFTIYESENEDTLGKQAYSLYDVTIYAFANGIVNTETVTDEEGNVWQCCLWDVLDNGALPYKGSIDSANKTNPANYDNPTHYLNNPLYAFSNYDALWGPNGDHPILEETSTTNVTWSILKYNGKYIAVYRDAGGDGPSLLPGIWYEWKAGTHPFNPKYIHETAKTPTVGWGIYNNLTTLVIDYGVEGVAINGDLALGAMPNVTTIVYPNGFDEIHHHKRDWGKDASNKYIIDLDGDGEIYDGDVNKCLENLFYDNSKLTDVIWANNDGIPHMKDFVIAKGDEPMNHLYDLRGMGSFSSNGKGTFSGCKLMENVVFGGIPGREIYNAVFTPATNLKRAWYELEHAPGTIYEAPLMKTIDIGRLKGTWGNLEGNVFGLKSNGYTIVLHQKIAEGAAYTYGLNKDGNMVDTFFGGNTELTVKIIVVDGDRNIIDPSAAATKLTTQIKDTNYTNRVYFYYPDTDTYKNPAGTAFAG